MSEKENLYFIALIPQQELCEEITDFKKDFALRFNSKRALRVKPHITLKAPFKLNEGEHQDLLAWFNNLSLIKMPFNIELNGFGSFNNKYNPVVFIHPVLNTELRMLQKAIINSFKTAYPALAHKTDFKFKPHITIAYRDLTPGNFNEAWKEYKMRSYHAEFEIIAVYLLQHDTRQWNIISALSLKKD